MNRAFFLCCAVCCAGSWLLALPTLGDEEPPLRVRRLESGVRFALLGNPNAQGAPALFVFATDAERTLKQPEFSQVARLLIREGWIAVSIDLACHGEDRRQGEPGELAG